MPNIVEPSPEDIKRFRTTMSLSQAAFGEALGSSARTVEDWEAGRRKAPAMLHLAMAAISARLNPSPDIILKRQEREQALAAGVSTLELLTDVNLAEQSEDDRYEWAVSMQAVATSIISRWRDLNSEIVGGFSAAPRFEIYRDKAGDYRVRFRAGNQVIFSTEGYSEKAGASRAVQAIRKHVADAAVSLGARAANAGHRFQIYQDASGEYRARFIYNSEIIFSTAGYSDVDSVFAAIYQIKSHVQNTEVRFV